MKKFLAALALLAVSGGEFAALSFTAAAPAEAVVVVRRAPVARRAAVVRRPVARPVRRGAVIVR
jgi:hypothetical protein